MLEETGSAYAPGSQNVFDGSRNHTPPVARLKRRILSRRTGAVQIIQETDNSRSNCNNESLHVTRQRPKSSYGIRTTPVSFQRADALNEKEMVRQNYLKGGQISCANTPEPRQRPKSAYGRASIAVSHQRTDETNLGPIVHENTVKDYHIPRPKTPQPKQRIKTYLERWKEAQLESRPCTAMGLMALERKQSTSLSLAEAKPRKARQSPFKPDKTAMKTSSVQTKDPKELLQKMRHLKEVLESATENHKKIINDETNRPRANVLLSRPKTPSTIKDQRERLENLLRNSKNCVPERSQTSLGYLTPHVGQKVHFSNNNISPEKNDSRKSVTIRRPVTPWIIARRKERPCTPGDFPQSEERSLTPGIPLTRNIPCRTRLAIDAISGVSKTHSDEQFTGGIDTVKFANAGHRHLTTETHIPKGGNFTSSTSPKRDNNNRRIIAARSQYIETDSDRKKETGQESASFLRSSIVQPTKTHDRPSVDIFNEWRGNVKDGNAPINGYSKPQTMTHRPILSTTDNDSILIPEDEYVCVERGSRLVTDELPMKAVKGRIAVGQLKEIYYETTGKCTPTFSQPMRCKSTPISQRVKTFDYQDSGLEDQSNKEDRILSWLGDCEESSLPTHLPQLFRLKKKVPNKA